MITDPVFGKRINRAKAHIVVEFAGMAYSLCCPLCQKEFERAPEKYAKPEMGEKVRTNPGRHPYRGQ